MSSAAVVIGALRVKVTYHVMVHLRSFNKNAKFNGEQEKESHYLCADGTEKSVMKISVCHHKACRVMTNGDPEG